MPKRKRRYKKVKQPEWRKPRRRKLMATKMGPWLRALGVIAIIAGVLLLFYIFAVPPVMELMGVEWPPSTPAPATPTPIPTPTPHPIAIQEPIQYQNALDISRPNLRFASDPMRFENTILFSAGEDDANGPQNKDIYEYNMDDDTFTRLTGIIRENEDIFRAQIDENWLVYLDHKRSGGGFIRAKNRQTGADFVVKEYYVGMPEIRLSNGLLAWTERTGSYTDKVFLYDLATQENMTAMILERSVFGQSATDISEKDMVWAGADSVVSKNAEGELNASIYSLPFGETNTQVEEYRPEGYVHNPKTNGEAIVWTDQNLGPNAKLYISIDGGPAQEIASDVSDYDIGTDFVVYCANQSLYVYFYGDRSFTKQISLMGERCIFAGFGNDTVFYYVTGGISSNDLIKYIAVNEVDAGNNKIVPTLAPDDEPLLSGASIATPAR